MVAGDQILSTNGCRNLFYWYRFPGEGGLIDVDIAGIDEPYIGGDLIPTLQQYYVPRDQFAGADTELLHLIVAPEEKLKALKSGSDLKIVWKEEKKGTIRDINYFIPA